MGCVLIFNNEKFDIPKISERKNSRKDVLRLKNVFYKFDYRIKIVMDPTLIDIRFNMNESITEDLKKATCLVVVLMTHGLENDYAYAKDQTYNIAEEILNSKAFQNFKHLPKILITQACKNVDKDLKPMSLEYKAPEVYNTFRFNSCFEGGKSARADEGSLFIKSFCENLYKYGLYEDVEKIAERVNDEFEAKNKEKIGIRQNPTRVKYNEGFDKFYFGKDVQNAYNPNQSIERNFI